MPCSPIVATLPFPDRSHGLTNPADGQNELTHVGVSVSAGWGGGWEGPEGGRETDHRPLAPAASTFGRMEPRRIQVQVLGDFQVAIDGVARPIRWPTRRSAELVQLLALAPGCRLVRDQIVDALWPDLTPDAGWANLRKAAFHARRALGDDTAVVLRQQQVALFPDADVHVDLTAFRAAAEDAIGRQDPAAAAAVSSSYGGPLLPTARYEDWAAEPRRHAASLQLDLLRLCGRADLVLEHAPTDEDACRSLMADALSRGQRHRAIAAYERHRKALRDDVGAAPDPDIEALYRQARQGLVRARPVLVGRHTELATIDALLTDEPTNAHLVVIRGPAGIGKTELARTLGSHAQERGRVVVHVSAEGVSEGAYATLAVLLERLVAQGRDAVEALEPTVRARLVRLVPALGASSAGMPPTRHQVIGLTQRLIQAVGGDRGCVIVVDDLERADPSSLEVLALLTDGFPGRLIVCLAHRDPTPTPAVTAALARAARMRPPTVLGLAPLGEEDARTLVGQVDPEVPEDRLAEIVARADGIPLFIAELAAARGSAPEGGLALAVAARLADLSDAHVDCLRRLALLSGTLDLPSVLALAACPEEDAERLLDAALASGVLVADEVGYRFRHELVRSLLADQVPPHQRAGIHRDAARRLVQLGGRPGRIADHWAQGRRPVESADWSTTAARDAITTGGYAAALEFVDAALAQVPGHPVALRQRATVLDAMGDPRVLAAYDAAIAVADTDEVDELRPLQALAQIKQGDPAGALETLAGCEPRTLDSRLARALTFSGAALLGATGPETGSLLSADGRRLALRSGDPSAVVVASWSQAAAAHARGELRSSLFSDLADTHALPALAVSVFDGQLCITQRLLYGDRPYADVIGFADRFIAEATRLGAARGVAFGTTLRGEAELLSGDLDAARRDLREGAEQHRRIAAATGESFSYQRLAEVALAMGDRAEAARLLEVALAIARDSDIGFHLFDRIYGARISLARDPAEGLDLVQEAEEAVRGPLETCPGCRITLAVPAAIASARAGDLDRVEQYEQASTFLAQVVMHLPAWDAALDEVRGHRSLALADSAGAASSFATASDGFARAGQPLDARRCADEHARLAPTG